MKRRTAIARAIGSLLFVFNCAQTSAADPLLDTISDDVAFAVQVDRLDRVFPPDQIEGVIRGFVEDPTARQKIEAAIRKAPGGMLLAVTPVNAKQKETIIDIAVEVGPSPEQIDEWVEKHLLPAIEAVGTDPGRAKFESSSSIRRITDTRRDELVFAYAVRDRIAFGSTRPQRVQQWLRGEFPSKKWIQLPGSGRTVAKLAKSFTLRAIFNPQWVRTVIDKPKPGSAEEVLHTILHPDDIQSAVMELHWSRSDITAQVTLALADKCEGITRALQQPDTSSATIGALPDDFVAVGRLSIPSFATLADGIYAITDRFDPAIGQEYRDDAQTFLTETGVNWKDDITANLVGEAVFGVRVDFTQFPPIGWAVVCTLGDESKFNSALDRLIAHFGLPLKDSRQDDLSMRVSTTPPLAMTTVAGRWILADSPRTVSQLARAKGGERPASANLRRLYTALGESNQLALMVDLATLRQKAPMVLMAVPSTMTRLLGDGSVGLALTHEEGLARLNLRWDLRGAGKHSPDGDKIARTRDANERGEANASDPASDDSSSDDDGMRQVEGSEAAALLISALVSTGRAASLEAQKALSVANMRGVGMALMIQAQDKKGEYPPDLASLLRANNVTLEQFKNPYSGETPDEPSAVDRDSYFIYRPGLSTNSNPREIILAERTHVSDGAHFLFVDGHVEFIPEPRASELIGLMLQGAAEIRP